MKHTFYRVGHGDTIFIEPNNNSKKELLIRDMGCDSSLKKNIGMQEALKDIHTFIINGYSIDVIISHAHRDHYNGFKKIYDQLKKNGTQIKKLFNTTYIPYLGKLDQKTLHWPMLITAIGMYLYFPPKSTHHKKAKNWILLAPIMADLSKRVVGVSNSSPSINFCNTNLNILWPDDDYSIIKKNNLFINIAALLNYFNDDSDFVNFCKNIKHQLLSCFEREFRDEEVNHCDTILNSLKTKKNTINSKTLIFLNKIFSQKKIIKVFNHYIDDHSIVFDIPEEALYLSDLHDEAIDEMFKQLPLCKKHISSHYAILKSSHHGTRISHNLNNTEFDKVIHCCGEGNPIYGGPIKDYNNLYSSITQQTNSEVFFMEWKTYDPLKKWDLSLQTLPNTKILSFLQPNTKKTTF